MNSKISEGAGKVLNNALCLAEKFGHTYVGSEHLLLALAEVDDSQTAKMLASYGIDNEKIKKAIAENSACGEKTKLTPSDLTPKLCEIIRNAYALSVSNGASQVDIEHFLLAICETESQASKILHKLGADLDKIASKEKQDNVELEKVVIGDDSDFYWDTLHLADELYEQGKYDEAEELYKEIANEEDELADASAHYGYLLDKMGRYEEAYSCFRQALKGDTAPAEGVRVFLDECLCDEDSPYWHYRFNEINLIRYLEICESIGKKPDVERILLNCLKSKDEFCASAAIDKLSQIYGTGKLAFYNGEVVDVAVPNLEKLKTFVAEAVQDEYDIAGIISCLCYDPENVDEASANALEAALLAITFDDAKKVANSILFRLYLFGMASYTDEEIQIDVSSLQNQHKAIELMSKMNIEQVLCAIFDGYDEDYEKIAEFLEEAHRAYPDDEHIAISLLLNVKTARLPELISNLSDNCAKKLNSDYHDNSLLGLMDGGIEIPDAKEFEAYYTSLLVFFTKYKMPDEFCSDIQKLLLSAYQFGVYLNNSSEYEISELEDQQKAVEFAEKYGIELLSEPYDIDLF